MQTTLEHMLSLLEGPLQVKVSRDRQRLVDAANRIRQMFYNLYREVELEVDVTECFELQCFKGKHCVACSDDYTGVTLPPHMNTVEAAWYERQPLNLYSKWRETKVGLKPSNDCVMASYDVPGVFPTERDISVCDGSLVSVQALDPADAGKRVEITYVDPSGKTQRESLELPKSGALPTSDLAIAIKSVVLPNGRVGVVKLKQACDDRVLSEYLPYERVPSYRRVKITGVCPHNQVLLTANRQFQPVFWDTDIVETDNQEAIINAGHYVLYADSGADRAMMEKAGFHRSLMTEALKGEASRNIGLNRENTTGRFGPPVRHSRLFRNRGGHNLRRHRRT